MNGVVQNAKRRGIRNETSANDRDGWRNLLEQTRVHKGLYSPIDDEVAIAKSIVEIFLNRLGSTKGCSAIDDDEVALAKSLNLLSPQKAVDHLT